MHAWDGGREGPWDVCLRYPAPARPTARLRSLFLLRRRPWAEAVSMTTTQFSPLHGPRRGRGGGRETHFPSSVRNQGGFGGPCLQQGSHVRQFGPKAPSPHGAVDKRHHVGPRTDPEATGDPCHLRNCYACRRVGDIGG